MTQPIELLTCGRTLIILCFLAFMLHDMLSTNMSIAILDMVAKNNTNMTSTQRYSWNERQINDVFGCFYWGYFVASLVSSHLAEIYGTRIVLGSGVAFATICTLLTPLASSLSYSCLIVARIGVGFGLGSELSSIMPIASRWIVPTDLSKFISNMLASVLGFGITLALGGYLIDRYGWPIVFYATGTIAVLWCLAWFYYVYDSPAKHPRISQKERDDLERTVIYATNLNQSKKPWIKILTSRPVWAIIIANTCTMFSVYTALTYILLYMNQVLYFDNTQNGLLSSLSYICTYFNSIWSSYFADKWNATHRFSLLMIRHAFTISAFWISLFSLIILSFWGYNRIVTVVMFLLWQSSTGGHTGGYMSNAMDISPNYSSTIHGLSVGSGGLVGYLATKLVALYIKHERDFTQWKFLFWALIAADLVGSVLYYTLASADLQEWNDGDSSSSVEEEGNRSNRQNRGQN